MTVDDFLGAGFMDGSDDDDGQVEADEADSDNVSYYHNLVTWINILTLGHGRG